MDITKKRFWLVMSVFLLVVLLSIVINLSRESSMPNGSTADKIRTDIAHEVMARKDRLPRSAIIESETSVPIEYFRNETIMDRSVPLKDNIDSFVDLARDDPSSAYDLATSIASCSALRFPEQTAEALLDEAENNNRTLGIASSLLDMQDYCTGLSKPDSVMALKLIDEAAARGLERAQIGYIDIAGMILANGEFLFDTERIADYKIKAIDYLQSAARKGNAEAYLQLTFAYADGKIVDEDPVRALAFYRKFLDKSGSTSESAMAMLKQLEDRTRNAQR